VKIHEYQGKAILARFGVPVPRGDVAFNADEAVAIAQRLGLPVVVKAQIHAGGRGKGGGVKVARTMEEVSICRDHPRHDAGHAPDRPGGQGRSAPADRTGADHRRELYLGSCSTAPPSARCSWRARPAGWRSRRSRRKLPNSSSRSTFTRRGLEAYQAQKIAFALGLAGPAVKQAVKLMSAIYEAFKATDASMIEINPLIVTGEGSLLALDAKMNFDDNALYRHPDIREMRDLTKRNPLEIEASKYSLNYIRLDGTIGCMVNGAGLAMATMDIIKIAGGEPANFLDVGGGANAEQIRNAFKILMSDKNVKAVFINIFGGILRCDILAEGVIAAVKELPSRCPS